MESIQGGLFEGLRVLEFGMFVAGPYAAELFAHGGADVIKIEPVTGDLTRFNSTIVPGEGRHYIIKARGKRGVPLNLGHPEGRAIARTLALRSDVIISNMREGALDRLGLGYAALSAENPRIIVGEISAFGDAGPYGGWPGADHQASAASGLTMSAGSFDGDDPVPPDAFLSDAMAGQQLAFGVAAALWRRERTGLGQHVRTSLFQAGLALQLATANLFEAVDAWKRDFVEWVERERPHPRDAVERRRAQSAAIVGGLYETVDGRWIALGSTQRAMERLLAVLGLDDASVSDPAWEMPDDPREHFASLRRRVRAAIRARQSDDLVSRLRAASVPCSLLQSLEEALLGPQARENGFVYSVDHPVVGPVVLPGPPVTFSRDRYQPGGSTPAFGEHLREVLGELGFGEAEIDALIASGAVAERLPG